MSIYTAPSLSGYNASATPDSDTVAYSWALHKNEIGDPLKTYMQAISSALSTAFGNVPFANVTTKTDNYTLLASESNTLFVFEGTTAKTFTLPDIATESNQNTTYIIYNDSAAGALTIDAGSGETIDGAQTLVLRHKGNWAIVHSTAAAWRTVAKNVGNPFEIKWVSSNVTHSAPTTTNYEDVTGLTGFTLQTGHYYEYVYCLLYDFGVADIKVNLQFNTVTSNDVSGFGMAHEEINLGSSAFYDQGSQLFVSGFNDSLAGNQAGIYVKGTFNTTGSAGTVDLQFANTFADSEAPVIYAGSFMYVREIR